MRCVLIGSGLKADYYEDYESESTEMELIHGVFLLTLIMWKVRVAQMIDLIVELSEPVLKFGLWC